MVKSKSPSCPGRLQPRPFPNPPFLFVAEAQYQNISQDSYWEWYTERYLLGVKSGVNDFLKTLDFSTVFFGNKGSKAIILDQNTLHHYAKRFKTLVFTVFYAFTYIYICICISSSDGQIHTKNDAIEISWKYGSN